MRGRPRQRLDLNDGPTSLFAGAGADPQSPSLERPAKTQGSGRKKAAGARFLQNGRMVIATEP